MIDEWVQVALGGLLALADAILGMGLIVPGEVMVAGVASSIDPSTRPALFGAVTGGAVVGDQMNYWLGRTYGDRLRTSRVGERIGERHWDRAVDLIRRYGAWAIILSRLVPVVRTLVSAAAGASRMHYGVFALASVLGSALWAALWIGAAEVMREVIDRAALGLPVLVGVGFVVYLLRRHRCRARESASARLGAEIALAEPDPVLDRAGAPVDGVVDQRHDAPGGAGDGRRLGR